jgi:hypothetical protein
MKIQVPMTDPNHAGTWKYLWVLTGTYGSRYEKIVTSHKHYCISVSTFSTPPEAVSLPFRLLLSLKIDIISSLGIAPGKSHQEPSTQAARVDSSDSECLIFDTVSPPFENARSTSVDVATSQKRQQADAFAHNTNIPGADKKSIPIGQRGCPLDSIAVHHIRPSAPGIGGDVNQSVMGSLEGEALNESKSSKYLFLDCVDCEYVSILPSRAKTVKPTIIIGVAADLGL